jgi:hypothetical protein
VTGIARVLYIAAALLLALIVIITSVAPAASGDA